jgi:hypothetical protein
MNDVRVHKMTQAILAMELAALKRIRLENVTFGVS